MQDQGRPRCWLDIGYTDPHEVVVGGEIWRDPDEEKRVSVGHVQLGDSVSERPVAFIPAINPRYTTHQRTRVHRRDKLKTHGITYIGQKTQETKLGRW